MTEELDSVLRDKEKKLKEKSEQNESLQFNNTRLEKRLTQLMFDLEKRESPSIFSLFKSPEKDNEKQVLREELGQKIRENERINLLVEDLQSKYANLQYEYKLEKEKLETIHTQEKELLLLHFNDKEVKYNQQISKLEISCRKLQEELDKKFDNEKILTDHNIESEKKLTSFLAMHFDNLDPQFNLFNVPNVDKSIQKRIAELTSLKTTRISSCIKIVNHLLEVFKISHPPIKSDQIGSIFDEIGSESEESFVNFLDTSQNICILLLLCFEQNQAEESDFIFDSHHFKWSPLVETFANFWESIFDVVLQVEKKMFAKAISPKKRCRKRMDFTEHEEFFSNKNTNVVKVLEQNLKLFFEQLMHFITLEPQKKVLNDLSQAISDVIQIDSEIMSENEKLEICVSHGTSYALKTARSVYVKDVAQQHGEMKGQISETMSKINQFHLEEPDTPKDVFPIKIRELEDEIKRIENEKIDLTLSYDKLTQMVNLYEKKTVDLFVALQMELQKAKVIIDQDDEGIPLHQDHVIQNLDKIGQFVINAIQMMQIREKPSSVKIDVSSGDLYEREIKLKEIYESRIEYLLGLIESCDMKGVEYRYQWQKAVLELEESFSREKALNFQLGQLREHYHNSIEEMNTMKKNYENQIAILSLELTSKMKELARKQK